MLLAEKVLSTVQRQVEVEQIREQEQEGDFGHIGLLKFLYACVRTHNA